MIEYTSNHQEVAANYLVQQYKESYNIRELLNIFIGRIQSLENQLMDVHNNRWVDAATDATLDNIGSIVGESRYWRDDTEYRVAIFGRIMMNRGGGTPEDLLNAIRLIYQPNTIQYRELTPLLFSVFLQSSQRPDGIHSLIQKITPLCIKNCIVTYSEVESPFAFAEATSENVAFLIEEIFKEESRFNTGSDELEVEASTMKQPEGHIGFAEIILTKTKLKVNEDIYKVDTSKSLDVLPHEVNTFDGFRIIQGNKLAEIIQYGG